MNLADLKRSRNAGVEALTKQLEEASGKAPATERDDDQGFWKPTRGKDGNGYAVIRFLPAPVSDATDRPGAPFVRMWSHFFQGPGGWYIENSRTTLGRGEPDPVSEMNVALYNSGIEADKEIARKRKRKLEFYSNILVISDPQNPENEGKVFLFKYGKRIFDKIDDMMNPKFPDEPKVNVFDFWDGADFKMKISTQEMTLGGRKRQIPNYDKSEFASPSPLLEGDDDKLDAVWSQCASLQDIVSSDKFKPYDVLKARLEKVLGQPAPAPAPTVETVDSSDDVPFDVENVFDSSAPKAASTDDDDDLSFFKSLADE